MKTLTLVDAKLTFPSVLHFASVRFFLHFSARKNAEDLKKSLETVVTPVFCSAHSTADDEKKQKLVKVSDK